MWEFESPRSHSLGLLRMEALNLYQGLGHPGSEIPAHARRSVAGADAQARLSNQQSHTTLVTPTP